MREAWCSFNFSNLKLQNFCYELKLFLNFHMAARRTLNVHKALEYLEDLEVSSSDGSDFKDGFVSGGRLGILPPCKVAGRKNDENSGEENETDPNHLRKYQLLSNAHVEFNTSHGNVLVVITDTPINESTKQNDKKNLKKRQ